MRTKVISAVLPWCKSPDDKQPRVVIEKTSFIIISDPGPGAFRPGSLFTRYEGQLMLWDSLFNLGTLIEYQCRIYKVVKYNGKQALFNEQDNYYLMPSRGSKTGALIYQIKLQYR